jgi:hypothetical protein
MARQPYNRDLPPWEGRSEFEAITRHKRREPSLMLTPRAKRQRHRVWLRKQKAHSTHWRRTGDAV